MGPVRGLGDPCGAVVRVSVEEGEPGFGNAGTHQDPARVDAIAATGSRHCLLGQSSGIDVSDCFVGCRRVRSPSHSDTAVKHGPFAGEFPCTTDRLRTFSGFALGRLFIILPDLDIPEHTFTLKFLFENPESLVNIVLSDHDLKSCISIILCHRRRLSPSDSGCCPVTVATRSDGVGKGDRIHLAACVAGMCGWRYIEMP